MQSTLGGRVNIKPLISKKYRPIYHFGRSEDHRDDSFEIEYISEHFRKITGQVLGDIANSV